MYDFVLSVYFLANKIRHSGVWTRIPDYQYFIKGEIDMGILMKMRVIRCRG